MLWLTAISLYWIFIGTFGGSFADNDIITLPPHLAKKFNEPHSVALKRKFIESLIDKCDDGGPADTKVNLEKSIDNAGECVTQLVNEKPSQPETEPATPEAREGAVYKEYCNRLPRLTQCVHHMNDTVRQCFNDNDNDNYNVLYNITSGLGEFMCDNNGEKIPPFITDDGRKCFHSKEAEILNCFSITRGEASPDKILVKIWPILKFGKDQCVQLESLRQCVVSELIKCDNSTAGNITDGLFKIVRERSPCNPMIQSALNSSGFAMTSVTLFTALAASIVIKL